MDGQCNGFKWRISGESLIVASVEPQIGDLKTYDLNGPAPDTVDEAATMACGRIEMDRDELQQLEAS
jgi:hypothetical protein